MKNLSLILNGVLGVAIIVLYYLHFSQGGQSATGAAHSGAQASDFKIAYINSDTVLKYYDYFKVSRDRLEEKGKKMDSDFKNRAQGLQRDINSYQNNVGNLTISQAKAIEEDLTKKQQNLRMYQESLSQELAMEESKLNQDLYGKVTDFLKEYGKQNGIEVVFKYDPTSDLLYGGEGLDITQDVIKGLNDSYKSEQSTVKADSTKAKK